MQANSHKIGKVLPRSTGSKWYTKYLNWRDNSKTANTYMGSLITKRPSLQVGTRLSYYTWPGDIGPDAKKKKRLSDDDNFFFVPWIQFINLPSSPLSDQRFHLDNLLNPTDNKLGSRDAATSRLVGIGHTLYILDAIQTVFFLTP